MRARPSSNYLLATAIALGILIAAATALAAPIAADKTNETPIGATGPENVYLRKLHARVHVRWADNFLRLVSEKLPANDPVNDATRAATVDVVIGNDGQIVSLDTVQSAGAPGFDDAAKEVLRDSVPFPWADVDLRSDDNLVHLRWTFARDERRCAGVTLVHFEEPLAIAIPKLIRAGRDEETMRRIRVARAAGTAIEPMMTTLATAWVKSSVGHPSATVAAAETLATMGDAAGTTWLKAAVKRPETALAAGRALAGLHVPICPIVVGALGGARPAAAGATAEAGAAAKPAAGAKPPTPAEQHTAALALASAGEVACAPGLIALLEDHKTRTETRVAAAVALGAITGDDATRKALSAAAKDDVVAVRAAATLAGSPPGSGRSRVFTLVTPLRDPSPEMRAAAAAGIVRAAGDANLDDLYVIFIDKDPRPSAAVATELDHLRTPEATKLLLRLLKRSNVPVQLAAARALIGRGARDSYPALRPFLDAKTDPELHGLALVSAEASTLDNLAQVIAASPPADAKVTRLALATYRARLARTERSAAGDVLIATLMRLSPTERTDVMAEWLAGSKNVNASSAAGPTTAAVTPKH